MHVKSKIKVLGSSRDILLENLTFDRSYFLQSIPFLTLFYAYKNVNSQFKNNLCEKAKADTRTPNSTLGGGHSVISEIAVLTLETDYS